MPYYHDAKSVDDMKNETLSYFHLEQRLRSSKLISARKYYYFKGFPEIGCCASIVETRDGDSLRVTWTLDRRRVSEDTLRERFAELTLS